MYKTSKKYMPTYILIALNLAVYVYTSIIGNNFIETSDSVIRVYGQVNALVYEGAYWQLFTAIFIHADLLHLFGNMLFLLIFGLRAEELFSTPEYFLIYLLSGLTGNLLTLLLGPQLVSVGASGAIFGMFGAVAIYVRRAIGQSILSALMYAFFLLMISWGPNVNFLAHLGGLVAGLLIGYLLAVKRKFKVVYAYEYRYSY
ncbi:rhomboid family intramembrane serine protease [Candidatus Bathyarchaeota archaeon]|nr:MAG: rhomboid family intramembrane serine protease [Candidatus Bathyarchaeota archaeon]